MDESRTMPDGRLSLAVRALRIEVQEGADAGVVRDATGEVLTVGTARGNDLVLADATVSGYHVELTRCPGGVLVVDHRSTNGTFAGSVRIERAVVPAGTALRVGRTVLRVDDGERIALELHEKEALGGLRGSTPVMRRLMAGLERAARGDATVLVVGESGTGKELAARALHDLGPRALQPFVTVDCGSLSPSLVTSELFGHERGAFTGADRAYAGAFERAAGGTLFLDEIGELPGPVQSTLLGVLERRRFRRVGGSGEITVDVRIVSATNRDLKAEVNAGTFRLDLYYRLAVVTMRIPPLREHSDDIPLLIEHFVHECGHDEPVAVLFPPTTMAALQPLHWPGNVRELRNLVEATVTMGEPPSPEPSVPLADGDPIAPLIALDYRDARATLLQQFEARFLRHRLDLAGGNVSRLSREARINRTHLNELLRRHGIR